MKTIISISLIFFSLMLTAQNEAEIKADGIVFPRMDNAARNALTAVVGQCIYNTTTNQIECWDGGWQPAVVGGASNLWTHSSGNVYRPTGNVGIGANISTYRGKLHIVSDGVPLYLDSQNEFNINSLKTSNGDIGYFGSIWGNNDFEFSTHPSNPSGDLNFRIGLNKAITIKNTTRNVGIGTSTPSAPLEVQGDPTMSTQIVGISNYSDGLNIDRYGINIRAVNNTGYGIGGSFSGGNYGVQGFIPSTVINNVESRAAFANNNARGTGTKYGVHGSASPDGTGRKYGVRGTAYGDHTNAKFGIYGIASGVTGNNYGVYGYAPMMSNSWAGYFDGDLWYTGTLTSPSDKNLKKNISEINNAMTLINNLNPSTYTYKVSQYNELNLATGPQYGFIAQELEKTLPALVKENNHTLSETGQSKENHKPESMKIKSVNYIGLIPILTAGIQELSKENEKMKMEYKVLQDNFDKLLERIQKLEEKE